VIIKPRIVSVPPAMNTVLPVPPPFNVAPDATACNVTLRVIKKLPGGVPLIDKVSPAAAA